jgi:hypothetical protein
MSWVITGTQRTDPDALAYLAEVERADGQALESGTRDAVIAFVTGCKADGIWNAIKASCILAGARTLTGALMPLVGPAPTNNNFVSGDYNRKTGLVGDGSTKYLNSNRNNNADPQNSQHLSCYASTVGSTNSMYVCSDGATAGHSNILQGANGQFFSRSRSSTGTSQGFAIAAGFCGISRSESASYTSRNGLSSLTINVQSAAPVSASIEVFRRSAPSNTYAYANARLAFYSIGESLDLALLDARVTTLINAFDAAI